MKKSETNLIFF